MIKLPKNEGLNIVPFIDIMLVLLAIILSISTFIAHGQIKLELPKSEFTDTQNNDKEKLVVVIDANNQFFLDEKPSTIEEIAKKIDELNDKTPIELKSDKEAKFESFVELISILKEKNHQNFQIVTERKR